ncbi:MAG: hypothetical protein LCI00_16820 [Chloroflexi bacterium]|nr:hypothetical protein [Chloroflexota bacterium]
MYDFAELTALFETDTINVEIIMEYTAGQKRTIKIPVATLTWLEWLEAMIAIPLPEIPLTGFDEKTKQKAPNPDDPDYIKALETVKWKRHGYRVVRALEKAGAVFNGNTDEKIKQVMNKSGVFLALHNVVMATTERVFSKVDDLSDSFRGEQDTQSAAENMPAVEADPLAV